MPEHSSRGQGAAHHHHHHQPTGNRGGRPSTASSLRVSGAADRFHRVQSTHSNRSKNITMSSSSNDHPSLSVSSSPVTSPPGSGNAPDLQNIDRAQGGLPFIASRGFHMPPEVLGQEEGAAGDLDAAAEEARNNSISSLRRPGALANLNQSVRKRSSRAVKATKSKAAAAAAVKGVAMSGSTAETSNLALDSTMFTFVVHQGMEVIFSNTSHHCVLGVCSRTNFVFQQLDLASETPIVSITSNATSGMVVVAHADGTIKTYIPMETDPMDLKEETWQRTQKPQNPKAIYGKFRWMDGMTINAAEVFYQQGEQAKFCDRRQAKPGELLDISSSYDYKLLVAHRQQLAVFDVAPPAVKYPTPKSNNGDASKPAVSAHGNTAPLSWTTMLPAKVVTAKVSGDGQAVVVVLDEPDADGQYGAMTFLHDKEDGSQVSAGPPLTIQRSPSVGMVFRPGPFLTHTRPVTRLSFRGLGHMTPAANPEELPGNDLLLTFCEEDSTVRIFNQSAWRQLMLWAAPPNSRADWIRGSSAFSLGDLETHKKPVNNRMLPGSRRPSNNSSELSNATGGINSGLRNNAGNGVGVPSSAAGAWIAEITFRGAYPALRLSRLSYIKRGNDDFQPAHFESMAAILPAGSIVEGSVLNSDDMGLSIQGVWPAWNPWLSEPSGKATHETLSGSAMQFLGLSSVSPSSSGLFGESFSGGTHSPPTELRIVSSHPRNGNVVLMEFPLWGDDDFGAMELGSPTRSVFALSEVSSIRKTADIATCKSDSLDYENSRLCAKTLPDGRTISLLWRKEGSMSLYSTQWRDEASVKLRSACDVAIPKAPDLFVDMSVIPAPLALPLLRLPRAEGSLTQDTIVAIKWWPDDSFGGPPLLVAMTKSTTLLVFEIPPPVFALEPNMPNFDSMTTQSSMASASHETHDAVIAETTSDGDESSVARHEYDVFVTPHPDFGLGLRLESPMDGLPAIAGSFKKNPLNDGMLPAEKTGMIRLGDELLSVNGVSLENMTFDDIIGTVRHVGAETGPGEPLKMRFRPVPTERSRKNSAVVQETFTVRSGDNSASGSPSFGNFPDRSSHHASENASLAAVFFKSSSEAQQEFGRVIAVIRKALDRVDEDCFSDRFIVLPWNNDIAHASNKRLRAAALVLHGFESKIEVKRLELPLRTGLDSARSISLGVIDVADSVVGSSSSKSIIIRSLKCIERCGRRRSFLVTDNVGNVRLLYLHFKKKKECTSDGFPFEMSHRSQLIINVESDLERYVFDSAHPGLVASIEMSESPRLSISVWHSRLDASSRDLEATGAIKDENFGKDYVKSTIIVEPSESDSELFGLSFLETGCLDSFPTIVAFLTSEAVVYQRRGGRRQWTAITRISYPALSSSNALQNFNEIFGRLIFDHPVESFPHILQSIRNSVPSYDERSYMLSDWHPESLLANICMDEGGAKLALNGDIKRTFLWLADKMDETPDENFSSGVPLLVAPFSSWAREAVNPDEQGDDADTDYAEDAESLMASTTISSSRQSGIPDAVNSKLQRLYDALARNISREQVAHLKQNGSVHSEARNNKPGESFVDTLPEILFTLKENEMRVLKALLGVVMNAPKYGKLDAQAQLALTLFILHKELKEKTSAQEAPSPRSASMANYTSFYVKRQTPTGSVDKPKLHPQNASAGCLSTLLSDYQEMLLERIRTPGEKLDWSTVRDLRLPFCLRSDEKLRQISEEVGQKMYRESKDILQSAIFFVVAGKKRTLMNLAAADNTDSGRKFYKFLTSYDFSSERGRLAAEKNAFSLLRKNKYNSAAAFFLLAEPPNLKSSVETIATKMDDLDLAFLVARLVGNTFSSQAGSFAMGGGLGGFGGFSGMGGGGGYAGAGMPLTEAKKDTDSFSEWKRELSSTAKLLISDRCLPSAYEDSCFSAVLLLWLGRFDEASHWITGLIDCSESVIPRFTEDVTVPQLRSSNRSSRNSRDATISTMNSFINLASGPFLLKSMKAQSRTVHASILAVSRALASAGIEIPAIRYLANCEIGAIEEKKQKEATKVDSTPKIANGKASVPVVSSSIFDAYNTAPSQAVAHEVHSTADQMTSSIFDSFEVPHVPKRKFQTPSSGEVTSSIFDTFDVAPPPRPKTQPPSDSQMTSSIFDGFDTGPRQKLQSSSASAAPASGTMTSSIFDSFDVTPPPKPKQIALQSGEMTSSIFDSFDGPARPAAPKTPDGSTMTGVMDSSTFYSCDAPKGSTPGSIETPQLYKEKGDKGEFCETSKIRSSPELWSEWQENIVVETAARRLVRELATLCAPYHCDDTSDEEAFGKSSLVSSGASQVLQFHCDGDELMDEVQKIVELISTLSKIEPKLIAEQAIRLLHSPHQYYRTVYVVLLLLSIKEVEAAEDIVRKTAQSLIEHCYSKSFSNGHVAKGRNCVAHLTGLPLQKLAAHMSWQLELCLWIHRGGALPLSGLALNEAICAVRIGYLIGSWSRDFEVQETMVRQPPDCLVDEVSGRQLWASLKIISGGSSAEKKVTGSGSGGWEFLVDCRRSEATELLRPRPTGCFIIRPHPEDHGVFTLSFKTNLIPTQDTNKTEETKLADGTDGANQSPTKSKSASSPRPIKRDDVVQHAIIRLSDSGFRCGSFGPFGTLMKLLEAVSASLPFNLRFDMPPTEGIIKDEGSKPSPNSVFLRKLALHQTEHVNKAPAQLAMGKELKELAEAPMESNEDPGKIDAKKEALRREKFGLFSELLLLSDLRKQLCAVAAAEYDNVEWVDENDDVDSVGSLSDVSVDVGVEQEYAIAARVLRPFLTWCRIMEVRVVDSLAPSFSKVSLAAPLPISLKESETAIEISTSDKSLFQNGGDGIVRRMIQPGSGVQFRTLRLGEGGESAMVVLFSKKEAVAWFLNNDVESDEEQALERLKTMECNRIIEPVDLKVLAPKAYKKGKVVAEEVNDGDKSEEGLVESGIRYRLVDPWEVEPLNSREAETRGASLGRQHLLAFGLGRVASSCEDIFRSMGGLHLFELWAATRGGISLTKALATVHAPWERSAGGDLLLKDGTPCEPAEYDNSIREHLYRNTLYRSLRLPQRFLALIQVELLDLKNLTSPGGSLSLTVYSLLRLKRARSSAPLTAKARTLDSVSTPPIRLTKTSGPNAPASWGSVVRFRFPLPENTGIDGKNQDSDCEALFKGPPCVLQVSVYEKKFMSDVFLGGADVKLDALDSGGQLEEWVPLKTETHGINWFARIRLTLRFELMCLAPENETVETLEELAPSVGLRRIKQLCRVGGAQLDLKKSVSTPDLLSYFESMVY